MNNTNIKLHYYQAGILRKLTTVQAARFNDLLIEGLESEHMNYHLKRLIEFGLVSKDGDSYLLTDSGKDYCNLMDDNVAVIEKQPKTSVLIRGVRTNNNGKVEHLLNKRLRQPYYGLVGRIGGKVRFGETLQQAAERELFEETGLKADYYQLEEIYHKLRKRSDGTWVQDAIFYIFFARDFSGEMITKTEFQENFWITAEDIAKREDLQSHEDLDLEDRLEPKDLHLVESVGEASGF